MRRTRMSIAAPIPTDESSAATAEQAHWHALSPEAAAVRAAADPARGLGAAEVERRRRVHGENALPQAPGRSRWQGFLRQFRSPLIYLLLAAAGLALVLGERADALVILAVVFANAVIGSVQEGRAERSMAALRRLSAQQVRVLREGAESVLEARALVPGDIVLLAAGDAVVADARLLEAAQLQVSEAALTGESVPVAKSTEAVPAAAGLADRRNMVYAGTHAVAGRARALVIATGAATEVGRVADLTQGAREPPTPLQQRLWQFGRVLVRAALALFVLVLLLGLWRGLPMGELLMVAVSQTVSIVPEGLPVALTIALAVGMQRLAARGAIVRELSAVETLGSTTVICTDKTGTLTRNEMTVRRLWLPLGADGLRVEVEGSGYEPQGRLLCGGDAPPEPARAALQPLLQAAAGCNDAELLPPQEDRSDWTVLGDPTEGALLVLAAKGGVDPAALRGQAPRTAELPFDAATMLMATGHRLEDGALQVWIKGAPEAVLRLCCDDEALLQAARAEAEAMAGQALRVLAFAAIDGQPLDAAAGVDALRGRARLLGLAGQIDPPRPGVGEAVGQCLTAGIRPIMVTGDHRLTGLAIARELGIAREGERAVDGAELAAMSESELHRALPSIAVFARVQPAQKLRIVQALQAGGEVVAMTGDGVNDAPALASADVGVAMGRIGTEVAKSASKIVVTDDNFATIVGAVAQGRAVYGNVRNLVLFLAATSVDEILLLLLALLAGLPLPLVAVQILWINIVTESTLTPNLVMDPLDVRAMQRPPVPRTRPLLDGAMLQRIALMAGTAAGIGLAWFGWRLAQGVELSTVRTEVFTLVAMTQWFNVLNCRSGNESALGHALLRRPWLLGGLALSVLLQALVLYAPPLNALFHTVPLPPATLLALLGLASIVLWVEELRRMRARSLHR